MEAVENNPERGLDVREVVHAMDRRAMKGQLDEGVHQGNLEVGLEFPVKKTCYQGL